MVIANSLSKYRAAMNESSMASVAADYSLLKSPVYTIVVPVVVVVVVLVVLVSVLVRLLTRKPQEFCSSDNILESSDCMPPMTNLKCLSAKADYCDRSHSLSLSPTQVFHAAQMSDDQQRASSLEDNEAHKLSGTVERCDSGFSSIPSICKLDTFLGFKAHEDPPIGCSHHMITVMRQEFSAMNGRQLGVCYATSVFAIAEVGEEGALLRFQGNSEARLCIPPGAVTVPTIVYMAVRYGDEDTFESYSPTYECGPDGLIFKKIVYLTFPHAATGSVVMAAMSQQRDKEWKANDGCRTLEMDDNCVKLAIEHFTGFKLTRLDRSARSRIPRSLGAQTGSGKKLALAAFASCDKVRLYIGLDDALLAEIINQREMRLGLYQTSPWKPFRFMREQGGLLIQGSCEDCGIPRKCFQYTDDAVLWMEYDYVEFTSQPCRDGIKITVLQPKKPDNCSHMTALFTPRSSPGNLSSRDIREAHEILRVVPPDDHLSGSLSTLSISSPVPFEGLRGNHSPVEDCDHVGACSCPREHAESGCEMAHCIIRAHPARANRESGYASGRGFSAVISSGEWIEPLKGVVSLENMTI